MSDEAKFLMAVNDDKYFIKIVGNAKYTNCNDFGILVNEILNKKECEDILVDLRETQFMDSTNLGLLAKLAGYIFTKFERKMTIISTDKDINDLLVNTGFDQIMLIVDKPEFFGRDMEEIGNTNDVQINMAKMMLDAHLALSQINEENKQQFKAVCEMLSSEVKSTS